MTDPDTLAKQPVRLIITPDLRQPVRTALIDWLHQRPEFRATVQDTGQRTGGGRGGFSDAVIIAVVAQGLLPGLFNLLQSWVDQQRTDVSIRVRAGESEVEIQVNGRTDPARLLAEVNRSIQQVDGTAGRPAIDPDADGQAQIGPGPS